MKYHHFFASNSKHRQFRQSMMASSIKEETYTRTIKYPLRLPDDEWSESVFERAEKLFNCTEGLEKGSLIGFVFCISLSGFRFYSKYGLSQLFFSRNKLPEATFKKAMTQAFNCTPKKFTPTGLIEYFSAEKRTYNKSKTPLTPIRLADECYRLVTGKLPEQEKSEKRCKEALDVCQLIANLIIDNPAVNEWRDLRNHVQVCLQAVDTALATQGIDCPPVGNLQAALKPLKPDNTTIVFDPARPVVNTIDSELQFFQVLSITAQQLRHDGIKVDKSALQNHITTATNNALSWLFGSGLQYWQETPITEIAQAYDIPKEAHYLVGRIQEYAQAIDHDGLFGGRNFSKYRSSVGGKLDSAIANTCKRFLELEDTLASLDLTDFTLPKALASEEAEHLFSGSSFTAQGIKQLIHSINDCQSEASQAVSVLLGHNLGEIPNHTHIANFQQFSDLLDTLHGELKSLKNRIQQEIDFAKGNSGRQAYLKTLDFSLPSAVKALPKLPNLSGGVPNYRQEIDLACKEYQQLFNKLKQQLHQLVPAVSWLDVQQAYLSAEQKHLKNHPKYSALNVRHLSQAKALDAYLRLVIQKGPEALKQRIIDRLLNLDLIGLPQGIDAQAVQPKDQTIYRNKKKKTIANTLIKNGKGRVYISPFSKGRHEAVGLNETALSHLNLFDWVQSDQQWIETLAFKHEGDRFRVLLEWQAFEMRLQLMALPDTVQCAQFDTELINTCRLPSDLRSALRCESVSKVQTSKIINAIFSHLRGLQTLMFRESFILRTRFTRVSDNKIVYRPRLSESGLWQWKVPKPLLSSNGALGQLVKALLEQQSSQDMLTFSSLKALKKAIPSTWNRNTADVGALLREMPHEWCLDLGFDESFNRHDTHEVSTLNKKELGAPKHSAQVMPLIGSTAHKGELDKQLVSKQITHGDYTLIIEQAFKQQISFDPIHSSPTINITPSELQIALALPLTYNPIEEKADFSQTYIGIDLGEVGIGYAVVCAKTHQLLASGSQRIASLQGLIRSVKHHRKHKQPRQKFAQKFDTSLMERRKNAVGDTVHVINSLMNHFKGVPVLESSVRNLASGSKQLGLVYDQILNLYTFSNTDAHKKSRQHFWCGGQQWEHPFAQESVFIYKNDKKTDQKQQRPLKLYPGAQVHPAGTSQVCSKCRRNPFSALHEGFQHAQSSLMTNNQGELHLTTSEYKQVALTFKSYARNPANIRKYKQQKKRSPMSQPLSNKRMSLEEAKKTLKRQLRRAPESLRSKDTTQSQYFCAFADCGHQMHADENAAINIVLKWIADKAITTCDTDQDNDR